MISPNEIKNYNYDLLIVCSVYDLDILWQCHEMQLNNCFSYKNKEEIWMRCPDIFKDFNKEITTEKSFMLMEKIQDYCLENVWRNVFNDTISGYEWFNVDTISLGRTAIGYNFAYVLSRILNSMRPKEILEFGLGQSSKIINSYYQYYKNGNMRYEIIEHDLDWCDFFRNDAGFFDVDIYIKDIHLCEEYGDKYYKYYGLENVLNNKKYELISIDAPYGYFGKYIGRTDLIDYIPSILCDEWVIIIDDYDRINEKNMVRILEMKLREENIIFFKGVYKGEKHVCLLMSEKWKFFRTL